MCKTLLLRPRRIVANVVAMPMVNANLRIVTEKYGALLQAHWMTPLIGVFVVDIMNAIAVQVFVV